MTFEELFGYVVVALTSAAIFIFAEKKLRMDRSILRTALQEITECVGASIIFLVMNVAIGATVIFIIRALGQFVPLYAMANWGLVLFSFGQGFLFQMWWRRSRVQPSNRKSAMSGK